MSILRKILVCLLVASCAAAMDLESEKLVQHYQKQYQQHYDAHMKSLSLKSDEPVDEENEPKCPTYKSIQPCNCTIYQKTLNVHCNGTEVTQKSIDKAIALVRQANNLNSNDKLSLNSFMLTLTPLKTWDLTCLQNSNITFLLTLLNQNLTNIIGANKGARSDEPAGLINSTYFMMIGSQKLDNSGFGNTLSCFEPTLVLLSLAVTGIEGGQYAIPDDSGDIEFLPNLSSFPDLQFLGLGGNPTKFVGGGQFKRNSKLSYLSVGSKLTEIGNDAFDLNDDKPDTLVNIYLDFNLLTDSSFSSIQTNGLASGKRTFYVSASFNNMTTLSEFNFGPFFRTNSKNRLNVQYNRFECDQNMRWLNKNRNYYKTRVLNAQCANDNDRSVFDSKKTQ